MVLIYQVYSYLFRVIDIPELEKIVLFELKNIKPIIPESIHNTFVTEGLADSVQYIQICEIENVHDDNFQQTFNEVQFFTNNFNYSPNL